MIYKPFHNYQISEYGEILGKHGKLTPRPDKDGYDRISLRLEKGSPQKFMFTESYTWHFYGEIPPNMVCCHIDSNIKNNHYTNLRIRHPKGKH